MTTHKELVSRGAVVLFALIVGALPLASRPAAAEGAGTGPEYHRIHFPVQEAVSYTDDFGAPRAGGRTHQGNDLMGKKLFHELAATDGTVTSLKVDDPNGGISGNMLTLKADDGWFFYYIHINNDTPGTDDAANPPEYRFAPGITVGSKVKAGDFVAYMGDSGDAETTGPHLHFEVHKPDGTAIDPFTSLRLSQGMPAGTRCRYDDNPTPTPSTKSGSGYWSLGDDGGVFSFGDAAFYGSTGGMKLNQPVVGMAATKSGNGYWEVARDGGIFAWGDATFYGSTGSIHLNQPIVGMAPTPTGKGYWLVASDGGIFAYGDAAFFGSTGALTLNSPIVGMASRPTAKGYWLLGADGGMFSFGDAPYFGSLPGTGLCQPPAASRMEPSATGKGYWIQAEDGSTFSFGDARDLGSVTGLNLPNKVRIIGLTAA